MKGSQVKIFLLVVLLRLVSISFVYTDMQKTKIIVGKDGSRDFNTIGEAIAFIPNDTETKFTVYIKVGLYVESVFIGKEKRNVALIGDGVGQTIISFNKSNSTGFRMSKTATVDIEATQFVAKNITFVNSAGPNANQAVAVRSAGKNDAFFRCSFEGYQDTIYARHGRKFFYDCSIYGTVDFICGDANIMIQNTFIYIRQHEEAVVTAESRENPNFNTAIVIQNCTILPASDDVNGTIAFLGRPWKEYSRTIVMQSYLGSIIDPKGWIEFDNSSNLEHLDYMEFDNRGPGAGTEGRVKWPGFRVINRREEALPFTVPSFINGTDWLLENEIPFISGLI